MTQFGTTDATPRNTGITTGREVLAYILAQAIRIAALYLVNCLGLLLPIYTWAFHSGVMLATYGVTAAISLAWGAMGLLLFLVLRGAFGGTPASIAGRANERAVASNGAEIGVFIAAYAISLFAFMALNIAFPGSVYRSLAQSHQSLVVLALSLAVSTVSTTIVFILFIALRRGFCRPAE
jgi:hypothetical protein